MRLRRFLLLSGAIV